jgi:hypothetical protein
MTYIARFARQNRAPSPTNPELTTRINYCPKLCMIMKLAGTRGHASRYSPEQS